MADQAALVELYRTGAVALDEYFCGYDKGRDKKEPEYQYVVEGRDVPATYKSYSSCADRAHARLWRLGCRRPFVNREERTPAPHEWKDGWNISLLHDVGRGSPVFCKKSTNGSSYPSPPGAEWAPSVGSEIVIWNNATGSDAHSLSVLGFDGKVARTANYGAAGMSAASFPGAKIAEAPLVFDGRLWQYGNPGHVRAVQRVLIFEDIVTALSDTPNLNYVDGDLLPGMSEVVDGIAALRAGS